MWEKNKSAFFSLLLFLLIHSLSSEAQWQKEIIVDEGVNANEWAIADMDKDGDPDLTYGEKESWKMFWYENRPGEWGKSQAIDAWNNPGAARLSGQFAFDLDQDGDQDLVHLQFSSPSLLLWYENFLDGQFFAKHTISDSIELLANMFENINDLDDDGDLDIAAGDNSKGEILWFENSGDKDHWIQHKIASVPSFGIGWISTLDIDGDDDPDIIAAVEDTIVVYNNNLPTSSWSRRTLAPLPGGSYVIKSADMDNDGDKDLVTHGFKDSLLVWYENPSWKQQLIAEGVPEALLGAVGDLDKDTDVDVIFAQKDGIGWMENRNNGAEWRMGLIDTTSGLVFFPLGSGDEHGLGDFNGDGKLDVAAVTIQGFTSADLRLYLNPIETVVSEESIVHDLPISTSLLRNYPNPFNPTTLIEFSLAVSQFVSLKIYDLKGRKVSTLVNENMSAGSHAVFFDAGDLTSGIYLYQLTAGEVVENRKMMVVR